MTPEQRARLERLVEQQAHGPLTLRNGEVMYGSDMVLDLAAALAHIDALAAERDEARSLYSTALIDHAELSEVLTKERDALAREVANKSEALKALYIEKANLETQLRRVTEDKAIIEAQCVHEALTERVRLHPDDDPTPPLQGER